MCTRWCACCCFDFFYQAAVAFAVAFVKLLSANLMVEKASAIVEPAARPHSNANVIVAPAVSLSASL